MPCIHCTPQKVKRSIPRRILVQLCDQNMAIVDECWLGPARGITTLDLNQAPWAVKGTAYCVYEQVFPGILGCAHCKKDNIIDSCLLSMVLRDGSACIRVFTLSDWYTYLHKVEKSRSIFGGAKTWKESLQRLRMEFKYNFCSVSRPLNPSPFPPPQLPTYDEVLASDGQQSSTQSK